MAETFEEFVKECQEAGENLTEKELRFCWAHLAPSKPNKDTDEAINFLLREEQRLNQIKKNGLTNKELRELLERFPDDALISIECCNPRTMFYDEKNNLIRID